MSTSSPDIAAFMLGAIGGALRAQRTLSHEISPRYLARISAGTPVVLHSLVSMKFSLGFGVEDIRKGRVLLIFHGPSGTLSLNHKLDFELVAAPSPADTPPASGSLAAGFQQPQFMVTANEESAILLAVAPRAGDDQNAMTGQAADPTKETFQVFALGDETYLIMKLAEKGDNDTRYLYDARANSVDIDRNPKQGAWEVPLRFARAVRDSIFSDEYTDLPLSEELLRGNVLGDLNTFVANLFDGFSQSLQLLSRAVVLDTAGHPGYYTIPALVAALEYTLAGDPGNQFQLQIQSTGAENPFKTISGSVTIEAKQSGGRLEASVRMPPPNFVLSGDSLQLFLDLARASPDPGKPNVIAAAFPPPDDTNTLLAAIEQRSDVIAFQSFKGSDPTGVYLVIWPTVDDSKDFVFTCSLSREAITNVNRVLSPNDLATATNIRNEDLYQPIHNAFHAIQIVRTKLNV